MIAAGRVSQLIGRELELAALGELVAQADARLVTLVGPGGIGKTRLAVALADTLTSHFEDGVVFVDLSALNDASLVVPTIAHALGLADTVPAALRAALEDKHLLLVLDNFEQVLAAACDIEALLQHSRRVQLLITSRGRLHLRAEHVYAVQPLASSDAVDLFVRRAQSARPEFQLTQDNSSAVHEICARLDGIPLALELAAARARVLSAQQIAQRLEERFDLLTAGAVDSPARHRTLRAALDWSFRMISAPERALLRRLSVFVGGATLEALESVAVGDELHCNQLLDALTGLVDQSLITVQEDGGEARYRLLETIRQYGLERLAEAAEQNQRSELAAAWCLSLAERAEPELMGSRPTSWLDALDRELDNLRAAMSWWLLRGEAEPALRLAGALWKFCEVRGHIREGQTWLAAALELDQSQVDPRLRSAALHGAGILAAVSGDCARATQLQLANLSLRRQLGDARAVAMSLLNLTDLMRSQGEPERAIEFGEEGLELFRALGERRLYATTLNNLALALIHRRAYSAARSALEEALSIFRTLDCPRQIGSVLDNLGDLARAEGNCSRAEALFVESLELFHSLNDPWDAGICIEGLAQVAVAQGQAERAARLFGAAEAQLDLAGAALEASDRPEHDHALASLRVRLGAEALAAALSDGRALSLEATVRLARENGTRNKHRAEPTRLAFANTVVLEGSPLTEREREVAALVAHGMTNKQIADALVITKQTADKHVGNILGKLGVASRSQVAVWVVQHGQRPLSASAA